MSKQEEDYIEYEARLNKSIDNYFNAKPSVERNNVTERAFEGGFRMAYAYPVKGESK